MEQRTELKPLKQNYRVTVLFRMAAFNRLRRPLPSLSWPSSKDLVDLGLSLDFSDFSMSCDAREAVSMRGEGFTASSDLSH